MYQFSMYQFSTVHEYGAVKKKIYLCTACPDYARGGPTPDFNATLSNTVCVVSSKSVEPFLTFALSNTFILLFLF